MSGEPDIQQLIELFLDDRESLSEPQWEALVDALRQSPEQLASVKDQLLLDEALSQQLAVDRQDFPAQLAQRRRDLLRDDDELLGQVDEMRDLAFREYEQKHRRRRRNWTRALLAAAVLLAVAASGLWYVLPGINDRPQVTRVYGAATLLRGSDREPLVAGERLRYADRLLTAPGAFVVLDYSDGTQVNVASGAQLECSSRLRSGKVLRVQRGAVSSDVAAQPPRRPMRFLTPRADAKVVGTELLLEVSARQTRLNVAEGRVELRGLSSNHSAVIGARQFGVSDGDEVDVQPLLWPSSRQANRLLMEPQQDDPPPAWEFRGNALWQAGRLRLRGGSVVIPAADSQQLIEACRRSGELSLEIVFQVGSLAQEGPARIVSLSTDAFTRNFTLGQQRGSLMFRLRTPRTGENGANPEVRLCRLKDRETHHLLVTYAKGRLDCYLDGERVSSSDQVEGDFSNWGSHYLTLGDEWTPTDGTTWRGEIHALAVYSRALDGDEALRNAAALRTLRNRRY